jgi:hypothetical protein
MAARLEQAVAAEDDDGVAGLLPAAERALRRWETERLLIALSADPASPFALEATNLLVRMRAAGTAEIDNVLKDFPTLWYRFLATQIPAPPDPSAGRSTEAMRGNLDDPSVRP